MWFIITTNTHILKHIHPTYFYIQIKVGGIHLLELKFQS